MRRPAPAAGAGSTTCPPGSRSPRSGPCSAGLEAGCSAPVGALAEVVEPVTPSTATWSSSCALWSPRRTVRTCGAEQQRLPLPERCTATEGDRVAEGPVAAAEALGRALAASCLPTASRRCNRSPRRRPHEWGPSLTVGPHDRRIARPEKVTCEPHRTPKKPAAKLAARSPSSAPAPGTRACSLCARSGRWSRPDVVVVDQIRRAGPRSAGHCRRDVEVLDAGLRRGRPADGAGAARAKLVAAAAPRRAPGGPADGRRPGTFTGLVDEIAGVPQGRRAVRGRARACPRRTAVPAYAGRSADAGRGTASVHHRTRTALEVDWSAHAGPDGHRRAAVLPDDFVAAPRACWRPGRKPQTPVVADRARPRPCTSARWRHPGRRRAPLLPPGRLDRTATMIVGEAAWPAGEGVLVRDQAAVRLAGAGAADEAAGRATGRPAARATALSPRWSRRSRWSRRGPRSQMERAVKGLVTGRYEWIGVHAA
mgnify:CR=1 FL=1